MIWKEDDDLLTLLSITMFVEQPQLQEINKTNAADGRLLNLLKCSILWNSWAKTLKKITKKGGGGGGGGGRGGEDQPSENLNYILKRKPVVTVLNWESYIVLCHTTSEVFKLIFDGVSDCVVSGGGNLVQPSCASPCLNGHGPGVVGIFTGAAA